MSKLNPSDVQGFALRGYNLPYARYSFLHFTAPELARDLIGRLLGLITTGQQWDKTLPNGGKPQATVNLAFNFKGLAALDLPLATLVSFPVEFQLGMKARAGILGDVGNNAPEHWDPLWTSDEPASQVHAWLAVNAQSPAALDAQCAAIAAMIDQTAGARLLGSQDAAAIFDGNKPTAKEHFGYTDGFGNPDYLDICRTTQPGQGKLLPDGKTWVPLATGELLLGYADEAGELPIAPIPHILAANGTFMVYRKLRQNVGAFRAFLDEWASRYGAGDDAAREKLAAKFIGRWRDGTPLESSPFAPNPAIVADPNQNVAFQYSGDPSGAVCPIGAHIRRVHPRDAFGFEGRLINRRRISRRGLPYGPPAPPENTEPKPDPAEIDRADRGIAFMALNASISRQFEFVQQQWINYGNDAHLGNDKDLLIGHHTPGEKYVIQGDTTPANPPLICTRLPNFVELRGGDYFFLPSITALAILARDLVDPR